MLIYEYNETEVRDAFIEEGFDKGLAQGLAEKEEAIEAALASQVKNLKPFYPNIDDLYKVITADEPYTHLSKADIEKYL